LQWKKLLLILAISGALSGYSTWSLAEREKARASRPAEATGGIPLIRLAEAQALWEDPTTLYLDVRSAGDYDAGHIPGALHLPEETVEERLIFLRPRLERATAIVVYCSSVDCGKSLWTAIHLRNAGFKQTRIYPAGWNEWFNSGLPNSARG
jgi:rhodanese-related sulfurtransferase